jgi:cell wall-associated NlpC family hydrolase
MRRGLILLVIFAALAAAPTVQAASWARPQIQIVVDQGLMGPSVAEFRAGQPLTRGELGYAMAVLTQQEQVVVDPERAVTMAELHRRLVTSLGLRTAAGKFRRTVANAGLNPPWRLGDETVARLLRLRFNHQAEQDNLELRPNDPATRAEAAYSLARVLELRPWDIEWVKSLAGSFALPGLTAWKTRVLKRAVRFVGFPYIWGGIWEHQQTLFGVTDRGGFDCSGFVWRVYKVPFEGGGSLSSVIQGRTTYQMSGEVPKSARVARRFIKPADVLSSARQALARGPRRSTTRAFIWAAAG